MKYLIHDRGVTWFRQELQAHYFAHPIKGMRLEPKTKLEDYLGWHRQSRGLWFVGLPVLCGRLEGAFKQGLRRLVDTYKLEVRLTPNQDLLLCNIGTSQRASVRADLAALGYETPEETAPLARHAIACPALPLCGLAVTEAERILPDVLERLDELLQRIGISRSVLVRMTGCPNGCARPYMAEIGLVGSGVDQYQLWLGGTPNLSRLAEPYLERMTLEALEATPGEFRVLWWEVVNALEPERPKGAPPYFLRTRPYGLNLEAPELYLDLRDPALPPLSPYRGLDHPVLDEAARAYLEERRRGLLQSPRPEDWLLALRLDPLDEAALGRLRGTALYEKGLRLRLVAEAELEGD